VSGEWLIGKKTEDEKGISNIEQGISNDEVQKVVANSQMTTGFLRFRAVKDWETSHSQMTMSFFCSNAGWLIVRSELK